MADMATVATLATAGGTLVLAVATFASVRSANRAARTAERALQAGLRPVLVPSRFQDPPEKIGWMDNHWAKVEGGRGYAAVENDNVYLAMPLRNVGPGIAVLHGWAPVYGEINAARSHSELDSFHRLSRDLYVPPSDTGFWQGAVRESEDPDFDPLVNLIKNREPIRVDILYGDHEGGQRTITRFSLNPYPDGWLASAGRHWNLDRPDPR
ncbi:MAG: hypothetical protein JOZ37_10335 [Actinobacteria bacterium]|nr:hypothetical protein [Actinomycetota bacterium]MBV9664353.1 hypothetical protein [Actinomycetota bacterium]